MKKTLRMEDLLELESLSERVGDIAEWKNLTVAGGYGHEPVQAAGLMDWLRQYGAKNSQVKGPSPTQLE